MAVQINKIAPYDASQSCEVSFQYSGGNQAYYNRLLIRENSTLTSVFDDMSQTMLSVHTIPANILTNGTTYLATIYVYDIDQNLIDSSSNLIFMCLSTPLFELNIHDGDEISASSYNVSINYSQAQNEELQEFQISLYSSNQVLIKSSEIYYNPSAIHKIDSLIDNTTYYIEAVGTTVNGMSVGTGMISFYVDYLSPSQFSLLELDNIPTEGKIFVKTNVSAVEGRSVNPPVYINDDFVDLTDGNVVTFDGFGMDAPYSFVGVGYGFERNKVLMTFSDNNTYIATITIKQGEYEATGGIEKAFVELKVKSVVPQSTAVYVTYSNFIDLPQSTDLLAFCVIHDRHAFEIRLRNVS